MDSINVAAQQYLIREQPHVTRSFRYYRFYQIDSAILLSMQDGERASIILLSRLCSWGCIINSMFSRIAYFDSDGDFTCFVSNASKTGFTAVPIKTLVHGADYSALCGRHRFSRKS